ncbi:MAG: mercury methylation corrinoid protein HgcA [Chloroflexi bacterium]|nr:mercury methylation corrinoid protein HgcA [Chloroflexota bacterium]
MPIENRPWIVGKVETPLGSIPKVATHLNIADHLGAIKARLGIQRMHYAVDPGLYAVGSPTAESPVFVSANYKLSFDHLRRELEGIDGWIMVIDTKGINVWCAAGKGTFGTDEIVRRIEVTQLSKVVNHRSIIVPQLGAPGVSAHQVKQRSSFRVIYGPVRARDIREFLDAGMKTSLAMRRVLFNFGDRAVLIPMELVQWGLLAIIVAAALFFLTGLSRNSYALPGLAGAREACLLLITFVAGGALVPMLLPWLPGRALSWKGATVGLILAILLVVLGFIPSAQLTGQLETGAWVLLMPAIGAFMAMNFTGATTYTSLSGVKKEMRFALPLQIVAAVLGLGLWVTARFV